MQLVKRLQKTPTPRQEEIVRHSLPPSPPSHTHFIFACITYEGKGRRGTRGNCVIREMSDDRGMRTASNHSSLASHYRMRTHAIPMWTQSIVWRDPELSDYRGVILSYCQHDRSFWRASFSPPPFPSLLFFPSLSRRVCYRLTTTETVQYAR